MQSVTSNSLFIANLWPESSPQCPRCAGSSSQVYSCAPKPPALSPYARQDASAISRRSCKRTHRSMPRSTIRNQSQDLLLQTSSTSHAALPVHKRDMAAGSSCFLPPVHRSLLAACTANSSGARRHAPCRRRRREGPDAPVDALPTRQAPAAWTTPLLARRRPTAQGNFSTNVHALTFGSRYRTLEA